MSKQNRILAGLLVVQLVVLAVVFWPQPTASGEDASLFPGVEVGRIVGLTITDAEGQTIRLAKSDGTWVLPDADNYPTQEDMVTSFLDKLVGLKADRLVTQTTASHKRLKVAPEDFESLVEFELDDGTRHQLYLGTSPSYSVTHVRADDQQQVYLTSDLAVQNAGAEATAWVNRTYLDIPQDQIVAVTLENANGSFEFEKSGESWTMKGLAAGETLDATQVESLVNRARLVTLTQPLGREKKETYGLDEPNAVVTVYTSGDAGDKTYTLRVGAQDPSDNSYVVISSESEFYVRVSEYSAKDMVTKDRTGFLQLPPTPTTEAAPEATPAGG